MSQLVPSLAPVCSLFAVVKNLSEENDTAYGVTRMLPYGIRQMKHQLDATLCRFYFCSHSTCFGRLRPKHVEWLCRNKTCTVLHQVGVSFDLYYDARKHKIKTYGIHLRRCNTKMELLLIFWYDMHVVLPIIQRVFWIVFFLNADTAIIRRNSQLFVSCSWQKMTYHIANVQRP